MEFSKHVHALLMYCNNFGLKTNKGLLLYLQNQTGMKLNLNEEDQILRKWVRTIMIIIGLQFLEGFIMIYITIIIPFQQRTSYSVFLKTVQGNFTCLQFSKFYYVLHRSYLR